MEVISFGRDREPKHWPPDHWRSGWRGLVRRMRAWAWLVVVAVVLAGVAGVLVAARGYSHRVVAARVQPMPGQPPVLFGVRPRSVRTDLVIGGDNLWRLENGHLRQVLAGVLANGLSPLLANPGAGVSSIEPALGGVIALIGDTSAGGIDSASGAVVFITERGAAHIIARASAAVVAPGGRAVWVQTAVRTQTGYQPSSGARTIWSPTYEVSLAGRRISRVLRLPLGLADVTEDGLLTDDVETSRLVLWNAATGRREKAPLPQSAFVASDAYGVVIWQPQPCPARCPFRLTDLRDGAPVTMPIPVGWSPMLYQEPVTFDESGTRLALPLERADAAGNMVAEALYLCDTATKAVRAIPGGPSASDQPQGLGTPGVQLTGAWDQHGLLWVLAASGYGYFQLGYWTGHGALHVYPPIDGNPAALAATGSAAVLP